MIDNIIKTALLVLPLLCSCSENDGPDAPGTPPQVEIDNKTGLQAIYTGKHFRLADGVEFSGNSLTNWSDTVWQNDRAYNQLLLKATAGDINALVIDASSLSGRNGEIPSDNIRLRSVMAVAGDAAPSVDAQPTPRPVAYVYDALAENLPTSISSGTTAAIWIDIDIPSDCEPGTYAGSITVKSGDKLLAECPVEMLVTGHRLPPPSEWDFHLDIWQFPFQLPYLISQAGNNVDAFSQQYFELMRPFYSVLADAGQKAVTTYIKDGAFSQGETMIGWSLKADGSWAFDYSCFDSFVDFMASIGIERQINCFSLAGWNNSVGYTDLADGNKYKYMELTIGSEDFNNVWTAFLTDFRTHLQQKGWFDKAVLFMDEVPNDNMRPIVELIRRNGKDWKIGLSGRYIDADVECEFYNYATIIGTEPSTTGVSIPLFYTSCSQIRPNNYLTPSTSPAEMSWMAWHALAKGFKGYQRWAFDYWTRPDVLDARDRGNTAGDFHMIYRTSNGTDTKPMGSIRFEMLRDGIQDYMKVRILGEHKFRNVIQNFRIHEATDASANVLSAQYAIKKYSTQ